MLDMQKLYSAKNLLVVAFVLLVVVDQSLASNQQWAGMNGLWGKRSAPAQKLNEPMSKGAAYMPQPEDAYNFMAKRAAQWQAAQGLWGKRSDPQFQQFQQYPYFQYAQQQA